MHLDLGAGSTFSHWRMCPWPWGRRCCAEVAVGGEAFEHLFTVGQVREWSDLCLPRTTVGLPSTPPSPGLFCSSCCAQIPETKWLMNTTTFFVTPQETLKSNQGRSRCSILTLRATFSIGGVMSLCLHMAPGAERLPSLLCVCRLEVSFGCLLQHLPTYFFIVSLTGPGAHRFCKTNWPTSFSPPNWDSPVPGLRSCTTTPDIFMWMLGIQTQVLMAA